MKKSTLKRVRTRLNKDVRYEEMGQEPQYMMTPDFRLVKTVRGVPRLLDPECGRAQYQRLKKLYYKMLGA